MDKLTAIFELLDKASGPAKAIEKAFAAMGKAGALASSKAFAAFGKLKSVAGAAAPALRAVGEAVSFAFDKLKWAALAAAALAAVVLKQAVAAVDFNTAATKSLTIMEGSKDAAKEVLDTLQLMANAAGVDDDALLAQYKALRLVGFAASGAEDAIAGALDVKAVTGSQESADRVLEILKKAGATGEFKLGDKQLTGLGITEDEIAKSLKSIDRFKNMSDAAIRAALKDGTITAQEGTTALLDAINQKFDAGKGLGSAGKDILGDSFEGNIARLKNAFNDMLKTVDLKPLFEGLKAIIAAISSPAGQAALAAIAKGIGWIATQLGSLVTPESIDGLFAAFKQLGEWIGVAIKWGKAFVQLVEDKLASPMGQHAIEQLTAVFGKLWAFLSAIPWGTVFSVLLEAILAVVDIIATLTNGLLAAISWCADNFGTLVAIILGPFSLIYAGLILFWDTVSGFFKGLYDKMYGFGAAMMQGLIDGITGNSPAEAVTNAGQGTIDAMKKALDSHSPSKKFFDIGADTMKGFHLGIDAEANDNAVVDATGAAMNPSIGAASGGGGRPAVTVNVTVNVTVGAGASPEEIGAAVEKGVRDGVAQAMEQLELELGEDAA